MVIDFRIHIIWQGTDALYDVHKVPTFSNRVSCSNFRYVITALDLMLYLLCPCVFLLFEMTLLLIL